MSDVNRIHSGQPLVVACVKRVGEVVCNYQEDCQSKLIAHLTNSGNHQLSPSLAQELALRCPQQQMELSESEKRQRQSELVLGLKTA